MSLSRSILLKAYHTMPIGLRSRLKWRLKIPDMEASLRNMKRLGFQPATVIDVGAYLGKWTRMCKRIFPNAQVLMCEPQPGKAVVLRQTVAELSGVSYEAVLLGPEVGGPVEFYVYESGSSVYTFRNAARSQRIQLPVTTLEAVTTGTPFAAPDLIKIDVQGGELDVLRGGTEVMRHAEAIILEVSIVDEYVGAPIFHEVQTYMADHGFRVYDICTIWRNVPRKCMNQMDVIFVRGESALFDRKHYNP